jgi:hypothetical protein
MTTSAFFMMRMNDHVQYLGKIKAALENGKDFHGTDHHHCKLGEWLDHDGDGELTTLGPEAQSLFDQLLKPHEQFHTASHDALERKAAGDTQGMEASMTEMFRLSNTLVNLLIKLDALNH